MLLAMIAFVAFVDFIYCSACWNITPVMWVVGNEQISSRWFQQTIFNSALSGVVFNFSQLKFNRPIDLTIVYIFICTNTRYLYMLCSLSFVFNMNKLCNYKHCLNLLVLRGKGRG